MTYYKTVTFDGDSDQVLSTVFTILTNNGFRVETRSDNQIEFAAPRMNSTRQNPIIGASPIRVDAKHGRLTVNAEFGGVDTMKRFMVRFPMLLGLGLALVFSSITIITMVACFLMDAELGPAWRQMKTALVTGILAPMLAVSPWLFIGPRMADHLRKRTTEALDTLVSNAQHAA